MRIVVLLLALATLFMAVLLVSSPSGTTVDPTGAIVDAIAVIVLIVVAWSLWRDRRGLF